jgi:transcription initiation factor TFIIE subunit alpha
MRLPPKVVEEVVSELIGEEVLPVVRALRNRSNVSELQLASQLKREINNVRSMLYKLYESSLVSFTRKKDKKKGWYIYYWTFSPNRLEFLMAELGKRKLDRLRDRLTRERTESFFSCTNRCVRLDFDQATSFGYKCPECGELLNQEDNTPRIQELERQIAELEAQAAKPLARQAVRPAPRAKPPKKAARKARPGRKQAARKGKKRR